jgi:hypothetical protein
VAIFSTRPSLKVTCATTALIGSWDQTVLNAAASRLAISATEGSARGVVAGGEPACGKLVEPATPVERARGELARGELVEPVGPADGVAAVRDVREAGGLRSGGSLDGAEAAGGADAKSGGRPSTGSS